jgi:subtilisin family serine protease
VADAINVVRDNSKTCDCDDALLLLAGKDLHLIQTTLNPDGGAIGNTLDDTKNLNDIVKQEQNLKLPQKDTEVGGDGKEAPFLVGIIDSGLNFGNAIVSQNEPFITPFVNSSLNYNFLKKNIDVRDTLEHGTKIARIILSNAGVRNVKFVGLKTFDTTKVSNLYDNLCAILYAIKHKVRVVNTSWGAFSEKPIPVFEEVLRRAKAANMVVVCSAGNTDVDIDLHPYYPACYADHPELGSHVITVTSIYDKEVCQNKSSSGKKIDLTFDAVNKNCEHQIPDNLGGATAPTESGTSYAAPYVTAGVINYINGSSAGYSKSGYIGAIPTGSKIRPY